jgi:hypothetical protein
LKDAFETFEVSSAFYLAQVKYPENQLNGDIGISIRNFVSKFANPNILSATRSHSLVMVSALQGDQIGRIFAHWVIVYFGQIF